MMRGVGLIAATMCAVLISLAFGAVSASPTTAKTQAAPVRLSAELVCADGGGANVTFTVRNVSKGTLTINDDFHLFLDKVGRGGRQPSIAAFVFPAPEFKVIAPGTRKTFLVPMGASEEGEPGVDLAAKRLLLEAEVFFEGRKHPARRLFSFPGCGA